MAWDEDNPGCAPEDCGGMRLDPCRTVLTTRGRWHDGDVPGAAADTVRVVQAKLASGAVSVICVCGEPRYRGPSGMHEAHEVVAVVADWLRTRTSPALAGDPFILAGDWAANLLDGGRDASR